MEIISENPTASILIYLVAAVIASIVGVWSFNRLHRILRKEVAAEKRIRFLSDEKVRNELSGFLRNQMVVGDADIRQGIVFAPVPPERLEPLAIVLNNAAAMFHHLPNLAADALYVRKTDGSWVMIGLDLAHVVDAARVMQTVAADLSQAPDVAAELGEHPGMNDPDFETRLKKAYQVQQKNVPDQAAIVWRSDLLQLFHSYWAWQGKASLNAASPDVAGLVEALELAMGLMQEAKGVDGPKGGFVTDHLDAAEGHVEDVAAALRQLGGQS
ncbi:MAG: hypothetical protein SXG53_29640 [Pseudomonadota bacterium]|nr:hypothetical protein [Pseudomonadota bacterium]